VSLRELLVGVEGLAILRNLYDSTDEDAGRRLRELRELLDAATYDHAEATPEFDPREGYSLWSDSYDEPGNPIVALEEAVVHELVRSVLAGRALDAACGTGRHAAHLVQMGHEVVGVDLTPDMLARARERVPDAKFEAGDLRSLPADDATFDLIVCGLALAHLPELDSPVRELARVLAPGGRLIVSVLHPFQALLGWHAPFTGSDGQRGFVREHPHLHAEYLSAFAKAGLALRACVEPQITDQEVTAKRRAFRHIPEATAEAYLGLPAVLVWDAERAQAQAPSRSSTGAGISAGASPTT
jgi:ubiquinone/menaquinone biosynthesis C-methylase UbiE